MALKGFGRFGLKPECCFPNQPPQNMSICFELPERLQILYCIAFFCLKGKLLEPKSLGRALFSDTEGI